MGAMGAAKKIYPRGQHPNSRANLRPYQPGQSGNPSGGRKLTEDEREAIKRAQELSKAMIERLAEIAQQDGKDRVGAALGVLKYGAPDAARRLDLFDPETKENLWEMPLDRQIGALRVALERLEAKQAAEQDG